MKTIRSLNTRLVLSHLAVSLASIILLGVFSGNSIIQASVAEAEHNLQDLAFTTGNALELPIQELREGKTEAQHVKDLLNHMLSDNPEITFTIFKPDGTPLVDSAEALPMRATRFNAPEVWQALQEGIKGVSIRNNEYGVQSMYLAALVQREHEVIAILRLSIPMQGTMDSARNSLLVLLAAALLIVSGVSLFGWILANNLSRPIQVLTQAAEHMEQGDLGVRVKPSGPHEMHRLAEAFNSMASRLQSNVNELRAFVANASHELRTPLTVVKLRAEALQDGALNEPDVAERFLSEIETEVDRLVLMVNNLLDLSRMEAGLDSSQRTKLNLSTIANEVYETFKIRATRAEIDLNLDIEPGLPSITGNEDQLLRVFYNLVDNAIKYTESNGRVDVLLRPGPNEDTVRILIRDTGPGITPEHLIHVFERFYRAETTPSRTGAVRGSGLGLAIAKSIVESHGGNIGVSSQMNTGTTFWVDLPTCP